MSNQSDVLKSLLCGTSCGRTRKLKPPKVQRIQGLIREQSVPLSEPKDDSPAADNEGLDVFQDESKRGRRKTPAPSSSQVREEQFACLRNRLRIKVVGNAAPELLLRFCDLPPVEGGATGHLVSAIEQLEFSEPTAIQMQGIPALCSGRDVIGIAPTGSGKTLAFLVPMFLRLGTVKGAGIRGLILCPTLELAHQIHTQCELLLSTVHPIKSRCRVTVLSKSNCNPIRAVDEDVAPEKCENNCQAAICSDILISTPLRLLHLVREKRILLSSVEMLVLDEVDRLFDSEFVEQLDGIVGELTCPTLRRCVFSATFPETVEELSNAILRDPIKISVGIKGAGADTIQQKLLFVGRETGKLLALRQLIRDGGLKPPVLIFVHSKDRAAELHEELAFDGLRVDALHGDRSKSQREEIVDGVRTGAVWFLITTDVLSRGMDFKCANTVINFDFPSSVIEYVHRIGRTGRAGRKGTAITFFTEDDVILLRSIANVMKLSGCKVEDWMLQLKAPSQNLKKKLSAKGLGDARHHRISTTPSFDRKQKAKKRNIIRMSKKKAVAEEGRTKKRKSRPEGAVEPKAQAKRRRVKRKSIVVTEEE